MSLGTLQMRKQGEANWDDGWEWVVPRTNPQVVISLFEIKGPEVKRDTIDLTSVDGVIDYSDVLGLHFTNKTIHFKLRGIADSTFNFEAFRRKYLGQLVELSRETVWQAGYVHKGRVISIDDNGREDFRELDVVIDAEPYRYPLGGKVAVTVPLIPNTSLLTGSEETTKAGASDPHPRLSRITDYDTSGGTKAIVDQDPQYDFDESFCPDVEIKLPISFVGRHYFFHADTVNGYCEILDRSGSVSSKVEADANGVFEAPSSNVWVKLASKTSAPAVFNNIGFHMVNNDYTQTIGDRNEVPTFSARNKDMVVWVNGKKVLVRAGETENPYIVLRAGKNRVIAMSDVTTQTFFSMDYEEVRL